MTTQRISKVQRGKFDDVIAWLDQIEDVMVKWKIGLPAPGAVRLVSEFREHHFTLANDRAIKLSRLERGEYFLNGEWWKVGEAISVMILFMERDGASPAWDEWIAIIQACRRFLQQHNPPADDGVKY